MKNVKLLLINVVSLVMVFSSCSKNNYEVNEALITKFNEFTEVSSVHSAGLKIVYSSLYETSTRSRTELQNFVPESTNAALIQLLEDNDMSSKIESIENKYALKDFSRAISDQIEPSVFMTSFIENSFKELALEETETGIENKIIDLFNSEEYHFLNEVEQNQTMLVLAIYLDSFKYWSNDTLLEWYELANGPISRSPGDRLVISTAVKQNRNKVVEADAYSAVLSALGCVWFPPLSLGAMLWGATTGSATAAVGIGS